jgi:urease accessory protein
MCRRRPARTRMGMLIITATRMTTATTITATFMITPITNTRITITPTTIMIARAAIIPITSTIMDIGAAEADVSLLPLMLWLSPAFPVGAFAYSHGLEWAVEAGDISDASSLEVWLIDLLDLGAPRADAILFTASFRAAAAGDGPALVETNALAVALAFSAERRLETTAQGAAFVRAAQAGWDCEPLRQLEGEHAIAYPPAVAAAAAGHGLPLEASLQAFVLALVANGVSAVVRLGPIGQTDGQKILATLIPNIRALSHEAACTTLADLGGAAFRSDIAAMRHETQYSRLFRS